ncbi:MAG: TIGR04283 family arsenosugar biosynthesis glycosyltransferase [Thermosynechococcaceae cyanobacterium]
MPLELSVIIPVWQEGDRIRPCLDHLAAIAGEITYEAIVVDGDSQGSTLQHLPTHGLTLQGIRAAPGRGTQMNAGAQLAQGRIVLFLHVDTRLPQQAFPQILAVCDRPGIAGGAFDLAIASSRRSLQMIAKVASWRSRLTRIPYGDQAIFLRKDIFEAVQGYPNIPIMEDVALMQRLKQNRYAIEILPDPVKTSPRRWETEGILRCTLRNWSLIALYYGGIAPETLVRWYRPRPATPCN